MKSMKRETAQYSFSIPSIARKLQIVKDARKVAENFSKFSEYQGDRFGLD
jgi:hypothetical protein